MTRLEDDLRTTLRQRALDVGPASSPAWEPPRRGLTSRPWFVPAVAAASALVFLVGAAAAVITLTSEPGSAPAPLATTTADPSPSGESVPTASATIRNGAPAGKAAFSYRGVEVFVPQEYARSVAKCDGYQLSAVVIGDGTVCATPPANSLEIPVVRVAPSESEWARQYTPLLTQRITVGGAPVFVEAGCSTCREGSLRGTTVLHFPDQKVVVAVSTWDVDLAAEILETAHVVTGD